jgi:hypothetical protein
MVGAIHELVTATDKFSGDLKHHIVAHTSPKRIHAVQDDPNVFDRIGTVVPNTVHAGAVPRSTSSALGDLQNGKPVRAHPALSPEENAITEMWT